MRRAAAAPRTTCTAANPSERSRGRPRARRRAWSTITARPTRRARLLSLATQVSTGDVDLRYAHFDTRSGDDITHEVASAFDRMLNALRFYALADEAGAGGDD